MSNPSAALFSDSIQKLLIIRRADIAEFAAMQGVSYEWALWVETHYGIELIRNFITGKLRVEMPS